MRRGLSFVGAVCLVLGVTASNAQATTIVYTSESAFLAALSGGSYTETFDGLTPDVPLGSPLNFSGSGFAYSATTASPNGFYPYLPPSSTDVWFGTSEGAQGITFTFTTGAPTAVGGFFYLSDIFGSPIAGNVTVTAYVGGASTSYTLTNAGLTTFLGFITDTGAFSSLVTAPDSTGWGNVNDLTVGYGASRNPVPEPGSWLLLGTGLAAFALRRRRQR